MFKIHVSAFGEVATTLKMLYHGEEVDMNDLKHTNQNATKDQLLQEITTLRQRVAELEETKTELENLSNRCKTSLESITDGFISLDKEWRYTYINDTALRLLRKSREELLGRTPWEVFPASPHLKFYTEFLRSCNHNTPVHFEEYYPEPLNCWFECHCYPEPKGLSVYFRDVTERKEAEEALRKAREELELCVHERTAELHETHGKLDAESAERKRVEEQLRQAQKMEAIGTFAGGIAHDFNNILGGILGYTEMAIDDAADSPAVEKSLRQVLKATLRARDLVRQILSFSRKAEYERNPMSISPVVKETARLLRAFIPANIDIATSIGATSDTVLASPVEMQQIIMNLSANAAHAMEEHGSSLEIGLTDMDAGPDSPDMPADLNPGAYVVLSVSDNGTGMSPDVEERIFEPFFTTRETGKGTGMGLSVVYGIVKSLHGTIVVETKPGVGSTFRVFLPRIDAKIKPEYVKGGELPRGNERILFVDDEEMLAEWGAAALERLGYAVTAITHSAKALQIFSANPTRFDLVITDQAMPVLTGAQLSEEILRIRADMPIILCTGHSDNLTAERAAEIGIRAFLTKPLGKEDLAQAVRRVLTANTNGRQTELTRV